MSSSRIPLFVRTLQDMQISFVPVTATLRESLAVSSAVDCSEAAMINDALSDLSVSLAPSNQDAASTLADLDILKDSFSTPTSSVDQVTGLTHSVTPGVRSVFSQCFFSYDAFHRYCDAAELDTFLFPQL